MAPPQKPGRSKQDYGTPPAFLAAVKALLGIDDFLVDLAASSENAVTSWHFTEEDDSLQQPWPTGGWCWLNPPFAHLAPWVEKAATSGASVAMLVPAGVGANWWAQWVHQKAEVLFLNGRLTFVGETAPYPKDWSLATTSGTGGAMDPREQVLTQALAAVTTARNAVYGEPEDNFRRIADLWNAYLQGIGGRPLNPHDVALLMVLMKVARLEETPGHEDSYVDVAGYAACGWKAVTAAAGARE